MANYRGCKVEHLVVDSGPLIRNIQFKDIGDKIYCVREVVNEIRDKATRERLQVLPYEITYREPVPEAYQAVVNFSKKTGDFASLSAVDLRVLALTYQLEKENVGTEHIRTEPKRQTQVLSTQRNMQNTKLIPGFYVEKPKKKTEDAENQPSQGVDKKELTGACEAVETAKEGNETEKAEDNSEPAAESEENSNQITKNLEGEDKNKGECNKDSDDDDDVVVVEEEVNEEEYDDNEGWITPANIGSLKLDANNICAEEVQSVAVACLTTDFAMQNVLLQMGLNVVSIDGLLIKTCRNYALRCHACYKVTTDMMKLFCPKCGNQTLQKVSMSVNADGSIQYYMSNRRPPNSQRAPQHPLPMPKKGKHGNGRVYSADQRIKQLQPSKRSQLKYNALDPDYIANDSPFAQNDLNSRYASLRAHGYGKHSSGRRN